MAQDVSEDLDVCDSWEDIIENGILDKKIEELQLKSTKINNSADSCDNIPMMRLEDSSRTQYMPQVKILKRPPAEMKVTASGERSPNRQPLKTLKQREAEYAEARLRILGSASSEEEQTSSATSPVSVTSSERSVAEVVVTRLPRGPDGTNGFSFPR